MALDQAEAERLAILCGFGLQIAAGFYWGGGLHRLVKEHERRLASADDRGIAQGNQLTDHEGRIGTLEGTMERRRS